MTNFLKPTGLREYSRMMHIWRLAQAARRILKSAPVNHDESGKLPHFAYNLESALLMSDLSKSHERLICVAPGSYADNPITLAEVFEKGRTVLDIKCRRPWGRCRAVLRTFERGDWERDLLGNLEVEAHNLVVPDDDAVYWWDELVSFDV